MTLREQSRMELGALIDGHAAAQDDTFWAAISELQRRDAENASAFAARDTDGRHVNVSNPRRASHAEGCECGNWSGPNSACLL